MKSTKEIVEEIENLFVDVDGVYDTIWYSGTETLQEAVCAVITDAIEARDKAAVALMQSIIGADRTPEYGYGADATNKAGESPPVDARWLTPVEICRGTLGEIDAAGPT